MSAAPVSPKRFLLTADGDLLNVDYIIRLHVDAAGDLFADMTIGPDIKLRSSPALIADLRRMLPLNGTGTP